MGGAGVIDANLVTKVVTTILNSGIARPGMMGNQLGLGGDHNSHYMQQQRGNESVGAYPSNNRHYDDYGGLGGRRSNTMYSEQHSPAARVLADRYRDRSDQKHSMFQVGDSGSSITGSNTLRELRKREMELERDRERVRQMKMQLANERKFMNGQNRY